MDILDRLESAAQDIGVVWVSHHANRCDAAIATCIGAANEIKRLRQANAQLQYALEQSCAAHLVPNAKLTCAHDPKPTGMYEPFDTACGKCGDFCDAAPNT